MSEVWKRKFEEKKTENPYEIAKKYCQELYTLTNKKVMARVEKYNQTIRDMTRNVALDSIMISSTILSERELSIVEWFYLFPFSSSGCVWGSSDVARFCFFYR